MKIKNINISFQEKWQEINHSKWQKHNKSNKIFHQLNFQQEINFIYFAPKFYVSMKKVKNNNLQTKFHKLFQEVTTYAKFIKKEKIS